MKPTVDPAADLKFRELVRSLRFDPDNPWVGGYVEYEWDHIRHVLQSIDSVIEGKLYLEFGCNVGATAIVLAGLGARVIGVDVDVRSLAIAHANAERYGVGERTIFVRCAGKARLPFGPATFDRIVCNSVLEYLPEEDLPLFQRELDRILKPGGLILVAGTSNRLAPREIHSRLWFTNYLPAREGARGGTNASRWPRGISPLQVRRGFGDYDNLDWDDGGRAYLDARARISPGRAGCALRRSANLLARCFGVSLGLLTPSMSVTLRKRGP